MQRVCFQLWVKPECIGEYVERHRSVPPEMLSAIQDAGRRNYSIFLRPDGFLVGYYETDNDVASASALAADQRTEEWERASSRMFETLDGERADQSAVHLTEVFNLESQLAALE